MSSSAFCVTHQKTFVIDGPTAANPGLRGTAIIMSLNMMPGYFGGTRDYAVITNDPGVVGEVSRVFDSDFTLVSSAGCSYAYSPRATYPPPSASDTPSLSEADLLWSPVNSKSEAPATHGQCEQSLVLTTEELDDTDMVCQIKAVAQSPARPSVRILLSGDTGSNASAVNTLLGLGLPNLSIRIMPGEPPPAGSSPTPLYMHGKQVIADGLQAFVGSENMTNTSLDPEPRVGHLLHQSGDDRAAPVSVYERLLESDQFASGSSLCGRGRLRHDLVSVTLIVGRCYPITAFMRAIAPQTDCAVPCDYTTMPASTDPSY